MNVVPTRRGKTARGGPERRRAHSKDAYRSMFENASEGMFQVTPDGRLLNANRALARISGWDLPKELMRDVTDVGRQAYVDPDRRLEYLELLRTEGCVRNFECQLRRKDSAAQWVSLSSHAVRNQQGKILYFEGHLQEINERRLAEEQLLVQRNLALNLAKVSSLDDALSLVVQAVTRAYGCDCAMIYMRDSAMGNLELASAAGLSEQFQRKVSRAGSDGWALANKGKPMYCAVREEKDLPHREALIGEGIRSLAIIPIRCNGDIIACFNAGSRVQDTIPASSQSTLELVGAQFGNILDRLQAEQELRKDSEKRKQIEEALEIKTRTLVEMSTTLRVLLKSREDDKKELTESVLSHVEQLIQPYVGKLKGSRLDAAQQAWIDIIESNLREITSPFLKNIVPFNFTSKEIEVIHFIKEGRSTEEIAELLHVGTCAIGMHRHSIRKKLGLNKKKTNLRAYLDSLV